MIILGWIAVTLLALYMTYCFVVGNLVMGAFSGKGLELITNIPLGLAVVVLWYFAIDGFPFSIALNG